MYSLNEPFFIAISIQQHISFTISIETASEVVMAIDQIVSMGTVPVFVRRTSVFAQ